MFISRFLNGTYRTVFQKDLRLEWRSGLGVSTVLAFIASSMFIVLFSLRADLLSVPVQSGLIWIIILFASLTTLSRVFVSESDRGTLDLLRLNASSEAVFAGKLLYNFLFTLLISSVAMFLFVLMAGMVVVDLLLLFLVVILGAAGLAGSTTLLGALSAQASRRGAVFPVLALPLLLPLMLVLVRATSSAFTGSGEGLPLDQLVLLAGFPGVTISASVVLFDTLWED